VTGRRCQASKVPGVTTRWSRAKAAITARSAQSGLWRANLAVQDGDLMPEHQDLGVLGGVASGEEREPAEQLDHEQADKRTSMIAERNGRSQALARVWHGTGSRHAQPADLTVLCDERAALYHGKRLIADEPPIEHKEAEPVGAVSKRGDGRPEYR
jgi:hypothetical protein